MFDNNKTTFTLTTNLKSQNHIKHIDITDALSYTSSSRIKKIKN